MPILKSDEEALAELNSEPVFKTDEEALAELNRGMDVKVPGQTYLTQGQPKEEHFYDPIVNFFKESPETEKAKAVSALEIADTLNISPSEAWKFHDEIRQKPTYPQILEAAAIVPMTAGIVTGVITAPVATAIGLATYQGYQEVKSLVVNLQNNTSYKMFQDHRLSELLPDDLNSLTKDTVDTIDLIGSLVISGVAAKKVPVLAKRAAVKLTKDVITEYKLPETLYVSPADLRAELQTGGVIPATEMDIIKSMGWTGEQYRAALKSGVNLEVPSEKIVTLKDKAWFARVKEILKIDPSQEIVSKTAAGKAQAKQGVSGLIEGKGVEGQDAGVISKPISQPEMSVDELITRSVEQGIDMEVPPVQQVEPVKSPLEQTIEAEQAKMREAQAQGIGREQQIEGTQFNAIKTGTALDMLIDDKSLRIHIDEKIKSMADLPEADKVNALKVAENNVRELLMTKYAKETDIVAKRELLDAEKRLNKDFADAYEKHLTGEVSPTEATMTLPSTTEGAVAPLTEGRQTFRITEETVVTNTQGKDITLPKGEEYTAYPLGNGKVRLQDGKQITVYEGELKNIKGEILSEGDIKAGGKIHEGIPGLKSVIPTKDVKGQIREATGITDTFKMIREDVTLNAAFKKAEQNARIAFKEGDKVGVEKQKAIMKDMLTKAKEKATQEKTLINQVNEEQRDAFKIAAKSLINEIKAEIPSEFRGEFLGIAGQEITDAKFDSILERVYKRAEEIADKQEADKIELEKKEDIDVIKKLSKPRTSVDVEYQKRIIGMTKDLDFKTITPEKLKSLYDSMQYFSEHGGMDLPTETFKKIKADIDRLYKTNIKDMSAEDVKILKDTLEHLTALGKLKRQLKLDRTEKERLAEEKALLDGTVNIDPNGFNPALNRDDTPLGQQIRNATKEAYLMTLSPFRVAEMSDGFKTNGKHQQMIKEEVRAEYKAKDNDTARSLNAAESLAKIKEEWTKDEQIRIAIVGLDKMGATTQRDTLMKAHDFEEVPILDEKEMAALNLMKKVMNERKQEIKAVHEFRTNKIFPEIPEYYFPLKYTNAIDVISDDAMRRDPHKTKTTDDYFVESRKKGVKLMPREDIFNVMFEAIHDQNWYVDMQPTLDSNASLWLKDEYQTKAGYFNGEFYRNHLDIVARGGTSGTAQTIMNQATKLLKTERINITKAVLTFKASSVLVQPFAIFDAIAYAVPNLPVGTVAELVKELTKVFVIPGYSKKIIEGSTALTHREGLGEPVIEELQSKMRGESNISNYLTRKGLSALTYLDIKTAAAVQQSVENVLSRNKVPNAKEEAELLMNLLSGTSNVVLRPHIMATGEIARTALTLQSFFLNQWGILAHDLINKNISKGTYLRKFGGLLGIGVLIAGYIASNETREKAWELSTGREMKKTASWAKQAIAYIPSAVPFFGNIFEAMITASGQTGDMPLVRTVKQGGIGVVQAVSGKDMTAKTKGVMKVLETGATFKGIQGTAQGFDFLERLLPSTQKGNIKAKTIKAKGGS